MVTVKIDRQKLEAVYVYFLPYLQHLKTSQIINVQHQHQMSPEVLFTIAINSIMDEVELSIKKKLLLETRGAFKLSYTFAQAVVFYRSLLMLPLPPNQIHLQEVRNDIIGQLDAQLTKANIFKAAALFNKKPSTPDIFDFDYD